MKALTFQGWENLGEQQKNKSKVPIIDRYQIIHMSIFGGPHN